LFVCKEGRLELAYFSEQPQQFCEVEFFAFCDVSFTGDEIIFEPFDKFFDGLFPDVVGVDAGEEVIADEEEEEYEISCYLVDVVFDFHLLSEILVLDIETLFEDCQVDELEVY
jgi:hypothetical protein